MKLKKFKKNKKQTKLLIGISVFLLFLVGGIFLYTSFAFYEEEKEYNVLKGRVPEFNRNDIQLAITVNGVNTEEVPDKGKYIVYTSCDKATSRWDYESWEMILGKINNTKVKCSVDFKDALLSNVANIGDYITYTPSVESYKTNPEYVGGESYVSTIIPKELTLWRVINKNEDGTIDAVAEYTSSTTVPFYGEKGYKNFIGQLNLIAKQYENSEYTVGSRYIGYSNQVEFIDKLCDPVNHYSECERDAINPRDLDLIKNAIGNIDAYNVETKLLAEYWIASRKVFYQSDDKYNAWIYAGLSKLPSRNAAHRYLLLYNQGDLSWQTSTIRPIITFKADLEITGYGLSEEPWKVN